MDDDFAGAALQCGEARATKLDFALGRDGRQSAVTAAEHPTRHGYCATLARDLAAIDETEDTYVAAGDDFKPRLDVAKYFDVTLVIDISSSQVYVLLDSEDCYDVDKALAPAQVAILGSGELHAVIRH